MFKVHYEGCPRVQEVPFEPLKLDSSLLAEVDKIWAEAQAEHGGELSNGSVFSVSGINGPLITGHFVEYKYFVAVHRRPELFADLQAQSLGVTGLSRCEGGIILGRRSARVTLDQGLWEFVPSGGVDRSSLQPGGSIDAMHQIRRELHEETGLSPDLIADVHPRYVIEDTSSHVFDIVTDVVLNLSAEETKSALDVTGPAEYEAFEVLDTSELAKFLDEHKERIAPLSRYIAENLNLLTGT